MSKPNDFFHISLEMLNDREIFPFHIYVFNPINKQYSIYLNANSPLTLKKRQFLKFITEKSGEISVNRSQKKTFLKELCLDEKDVSDLTKTTIHPLLKARKIYLKILEDKQDNESFIFQHEIKKSIKNDDYNFIIERAHDEIVTFNVTTSHTVSLAIYFAEQLLIEDNFINRIVAVSYFIAKTNDINDELLLSDIICAAFLHHIGVTQIDNYISHKILFEMSSAEKKDYHKHPGLTQHLIRKSSLSLSQGCINIILQHHERYDGSGLPNGKKGIHIEPMALLLGAVSHIFEYSAGKIDGNSRPLKAILNNLKNKTLTAGLEFEFGDTIYNNLINIINEEKQILNIAA